MRIAPTFPISPLIAIPSKFLTTVATSLTAVPSVLHVMAHRRVTFRGAFLFTILFKEREREREREREIQNKKLPPFAARHRAVAAGRLSSRGRLVRAAGRPMDEDDFYTKRPGSWLMDEMCKVRNVVLALLVVQTTSIVLLMRFSRTMDRPPDAGAFLLLPKATSQ
eukprot:scaffold6470_cov124-Isochrysis_galbana.AAC.1